MENKFYKVMSAHSDEKLIEVYKNQTQYTSEAIEAMELILVERNLLENATQAFNLNNEAVYNKFQLREFGRVISDSDFARESLKDSIYFQRYISPLHKYNWLNYIFCIFGSVGIANSATIIGIGEYDSPFKALLYLSILVAMLLPLGIWKLSKNKAQISVIKKRKGNALSIIGAKDNHEIQIPFRYECYWEWYYIKYIKFVKLSVFLVDEKNDTVIELRECLETFKSPPLNWERLPKDLGSRFKNKTCIAFVSYNFQKPYLQKLQKILNGLSLDN